MCSCTRFGNTVINFYYNFLLQNKFLVLFQNTILSIIRTKETKISGCVLTINVDRPLIIIVRTASFKIFSLKIIKSKLSSKFVREKQALDVRELTVPTTLSEKLNKLIKFENTEQRSRRISNTNGLIWQYQFINYSILLLLNKRAKENHISIYLVSLSEEFIFSPLNKRVTIQPKIFDIRIVFWNALNFTVLLLNSIKLLQAVQILYYLKFFLIHSNNVNFLLVTDRWYNLTDQSFILKSSYSKNYITGHKEFFSFCDQFFQIITFNKPNVFTTKALPVIIRLPNLLFSISLIKINIVVHNTAKLQLFETPEVIFNWSTSIIRPYSVIGDVLIGSCSPARNPFIKVTKNFWPLESFYELIYRAKKTINLQAITIVADSFVLPQNNFTFANESKNNLGSSVLQLDILPICVGITNNYCRIGTIFTKLEGKSYIKKINLFQLKQGIYNQSYRHHKLSKFPNSAYASISNYSTLIAELLTRVILVSSRWLQIYVTKIYISCHSIISLNSHHNHLLVDNRGVCLGAKLMFVARYTSSSPRLNNGTELIIEVNYTSGDHAIYFRKPIETDKYFFKFMIDWYVFLLSIKFYMFQNTSKTKFIHDCFVNLSPLPAKHGWISLVFFDGRYGLIWRYSVGCELDVCIRVKFNTLIESRSLKVKKFFVWVRRTPFPLFLPWLPLNL